MTTFVDSFQDQFSLTPYEAIAEFRTETNPEQTYNEYVDEFVASTEEIIDEFHQWQDEAEAAISQYQQPLMEKHAARDIWDEIEPETRSKDKLNNYRDQPVLATIQTVFTEGQPVTSRDIWDRTTGWDSSTVVITEYGTFNPYSNSASAAAMMRMRKVIRNHVEWITMGSININLDNLEYYCGQHKCEFEGSLDIYKDDAELREYGILMILKHLGTHNPFNNLTYPFPPIKRVPVTRNTDDYLINSHMFYCTNSECNHTYLNESAK